MVAGESLVVIYRRTASFALLALPFPKDTGEICGVLVGYTCCTTYLPLLETGKRKLEDS
jgi:hypothetical protein